MVFSSLTFLYLFLPAVMLLYCIVPARARNAVLLIASMAFYFCGEQLYLLLMLGEIALTYVAGRLMEAGDGSVDFRKNGAAEKKAYDAGVNVGRAVQTVPVGEGRNDNRGRQRKCVLIMFLILSFGLLTLFKYADLLPETVNALAGTGVLGLLRLPLPIGISFYIFQSVSYGIDVYRGRYPAEKNPFRLALYISFFPQLIAGPIVRYDAVREKLAAARTIEVRRLERGIVRFCAGLGKKVLIADRLYALCEAAAAVSAPSVVLAWVEGLAFLLYVYFDFSGYSDMAIGLACCFGFDIPENFRYPLISGSVREFWRRWHVSLGTWFRDYLYIPLGGSRRGLWRHIRNLLIVWCLTGLWHGASWNFVIWGVCFGAILILEVLFGRNALTTLASGDVPSPGIVPAAGDVSASGIVSASADASTLGDASVSKKTSAQGMRGRVALRTLRTAAVLTGTVLIFVWFRFIEVHDAVSQFGKMFGTVPFWSADTAYILSSGIILLAAALLGATPIPKHLMHLLEKRKGAEFLIPILETVWVLLILLFVTAYLVDGSFSPFLYFRF